MNDELSGDSMFVGAWKDLLSGSKDIHDGDQVQDEKLDHRGTAIVGDAVQIDKNDVRQTLSLQPSNRRRTKGSAVVLSSQKMQKLLDPNRLTPSISRHGSDLTAAVDDIIQARKVLHMRNDATNVIQRFWRKYIILQIRARKRKKYLQGGKWTKCQSDLVFSLFLGWRIRFLMRSIRIQKSLKALNDVYTVLTDIISSSPLLTPISSSLGPPTFFTKDNKQAENGTSKAKAESERRQMFDAIREMKINQSVNNRSSTNAGLNGSQRTYADRVLVDRLVKEALLKRAVVHRIFFEGACWFPFPCNYSTNISSNGTSSSSGSNHRRDRNNLYTVEILKKGFEGGYWDLSPAVRSILTTLNTHTVAEGNMSANTSLIHSPRRIGNESDNGAFSPPNIFSDIGNISSPPREHYPTQHTIQHTTPLQRSTPQKRREDTFHSDSEEYKISNDDSNISNSSHRNIEKQKSGTGSERSSERSSDRSKECSPDIRLLRRPPSSYQSNPNFPKKGDDSEVGILNDENREIFNKRDTSRDISRESDRSSERGCDRGSAVDSCESIIQSQLLSLRAQVQNAIKKRSKGIFGSVDDSDFLSKEKEKKEKENEKVKEKDSEKEFDIKTKGIISRKSSQANIKSVPVPLSQNVFGSVSVSSIINSSNSNSNSNLNSNLKLNLNLNLNSNISKSSSFISSTPISMSVRPDNMKACVQLDILHADRLMPAKKVRVRVRESMYVRVYVFMCVYDIVSIVFIFIF